jgi:hypothetical protein
MEGGEGMTWDNDKITVTFTLDEAITVLAALKVAGDEVTRQHADSATRKIDAEILGDNLGPFEPLRSVMTEPS